MKLITWNVNGIRACVKKGFLDYFQQEQADAFCLQETKLQANQIDLELEGYHQYWHYAERKGYSGTAIFVKEKPISVSYDFEIDKFNDEGRVITLEYPNYYLVNAYVPNSQDKLKRIDYRLAWEKELLAHLNKLKQEKSVIYCGDLNVAHQEIDLKNPKANRKNAGFSDQERAQFQELLSNDYLDVFRYLYPEKVAYTWWSYRFNARLNNAGWRIDYFITSSNLKDKIIDLKIDSEITGSDHCPVILEINI